MIENPHYRKNRIYRSRKNKIFWGVCGGIAEHFDFHPWGVRGIFLVLGIMLVPLPFVAIGYAILAFTLRKAPEHPFANYEEEEFWNTFQTSRSAALRKIHRQFQTLDQRLQRMESIVTSPQFELEDEYRGL